MHVLYIHQYFVPPDGSGGTRSYELARRLVQKGHEVTVLTSNAFFPSHYQFSSRVTEIQLEGFRLAVLAVPYSNRQSFSRRVRAFLSFAAESSAFSCKVRGADVVFATSTPLTVALPAFIASRYLRIPQVFEVRDLWPEVPIGLGVLRNPLAVWASKALERWAYRNSTRVVALSPGMRDGVVSAGYPKEKVSVIPNGCDVERFAVSTEVGQRFLGEHPELAQGPLVVYTGTLGFANNLGYLVDIAGEMLGIDPRISFLVVGDGREEEVVRARATAQGVLGRNFWLHPPLPKAEIPAVLSASTLASSFVLDNPVMWNNSANKFFDALAAGRPVLINHEGWQADLIRRRGIGVVVPAAEPREAANRIREFCRAPAGLEQARRAARELAATEFSRDRLADRLNAVLEEVVTGRHQ